MNSYVPNRIWFPCSAQWVDAVEIYFSEEDKQDKMTEPIVVTDIDDGIFVEIGNDIGSSGRLSFGVYTQDRCALSHTVMPGDVFKSVIQANEGDVIHSRISCRCKGYIRMSSYPWAVIRVR